jgi:hypothetical protein
MQRIFIKKCHVFTVGSVCRVKRLTVKRFADDEEVRKWLRQQSEDFYAAGFDALVKRLDKCISVGGGYSRNRFFSQVQISHVLRFISIYYLFTDSPS